MASKDTDKPVYYQTELSNLDNPDTRKLFVDILKTCWKGMEFNEETQTFVSKKEMVHRFDNEGRLVQC